MLKKLLHLFGPALAMLAALGIIDYHDYGWRIGTLCVADKIGWLEFIFAFVATSFLPTICFSFAWHFLRAGHRSRAKFIVLVGISFAVALWLGNAHFNHTAICAYEPD